MHLPISNTYAHTQRSCLQTSNPARFTFAGLGGWCQGVTSAECDLPCREHYYPREEFKHGRAAGCHLQQPAWKCRERTVGAFKKGEGGAHKKKNSVGFQGASQLRTCCRADLTAPFPPHILGTRSGTILNRTPAGADTMSEPASSNYTMQMPSRPFNAASGVSPQLVCRLSPGAHTHLWRPEEEGWGVICSFIHLEILLLLRF